MDGFFFAYCSFCFNSYIACNLKYIWVKLKKAIIVFIILCSSLNAQLRKDSLAINYGIEYFPFNKNIELLFESNVGETVKSVKKIDSTFQVTNISDKFIYTQTFLKNDEGIYLIKTEQNISTFLYSTDIVVTYSKPVLQLPIPLKIGDTWNWSGFQIKNGDTSSISISGVALREEDIDIPVGKFSTLHIKLFFDEVDGEKTTLDQWLAPNLGAVKTKVIIEGKGVIQFAMSILGYDEIDSELEEIRYLE